MSDAQQVGDAGTGRRVSWIANAALLVVSLGFVCIAAEYVFRFRYAHLIYTPRAEVRAVQQYLTLDPDIGFRWREHIGAGQNVRFAINDIEPEPLVTDRFGVINAVEAIRKREDAKTVEVIGLGDSFMEMAARGFHEQLGERGFDYYSLAIHRQCPAQYTRILQRWGKELRPRVAIYGLYENDFNEMSDYQSWKRSGVDWFTYHSGTWCGPPIGVGAMERALRTRTRGWYSFGLVIDARLRGERVSVSGPSELEVRDVASAVAEAKQTCEQSGIRLVLLLIPSKQTATDGNTAEAEAYDAVIKEVQCDVIDLRPVFQRHVEPESLYYVKDGHWNARGVDLAADHVSMYLEGLTP
ncbi:MAG TPA: hypothetical protein PLJ47_05640 [Candidatus Hydrogenedentes bacterium]|nr:hypothetical protein [Candidatus Hydrogenedentota bacterium]HRK34061.1 hypothetical protein [Candidatus Hydrogenedentota bacterium]